MLVSWKGLPPHEATWENCADLKVQFPELYLEDKVDLEEESDARPPILFTYNRRKKDSNKGARGSSEESKETGDQSGGTTS